RMRRLSLKEVRALQKSRPEPADDDDGPYGPPSEPGPAAGRDDGLREPEAAPSARRSAPAGHAVTIPTYGAVDTTGAQAHERTVAEAVSTATTGTSDRSDTPQKCRYEPTCQNGSVAGEVGAAAGADGDAPRLTPGPASDSFEPYVYMPEDPELREIVREIEA